MAEIEKLAFEHREIAEALVKHQGLHEGIWGVTVEFGFNATNIGSSEADLAPSVIVAVLKIGLLKFPKESNLTVDAAKVNPRPSPKRKTTKKKKK